MEQRRDDKLICLAAVAGAHGVRGALKLRCFTEEPENVAAYGPVFDKDGRKLFALRLIGPWKAGVIAKASGIDDRDKAEALQGQELFLPRALLPEADEDEFYHEDLIGLDAMGEHGCVGVVRAIEDHGAGAILAIERADGTTLDLPFTFEHVPEIDLARGRLTVRPPEEVDA